MVDLISSLESSCPVPFYRCDRRIGSRAGSRDNEDNGEATPRIVPRAVSEMLPVRIGLVRVVCFVLLDPNFRSRQQKNKCFYNWANVSRLFFVYICCMYLGTERNFQTKMFCSCCRHCLRNVNSLMATAGLMKANTALTTSSTSLCQPSLAHMQCEIHRDKKPTLDCSVR